MADPRPASPPDVGPSFRAALLRALASATVVIALVAAAFWGIGSAGDDPGEPAAAPEQQPGTDERDDGEQVEQDAPADGEVDGDAPAPEPDPAEPEPDEGDATDPGTGDDDEASAPDDDDASAPIEPPADRIDPATISVQVLDGFQADGGAAAREVAAQLREAGYRLIAENPALRYEVTTVLWTGDNDAAGRQIAAELGASEARQQPGNLSQQVMVHVVVGADRG